MDFCKLSAHEIASGVLSKKWSAEEVLNAHLARIKKHDGKIKIT